MARTCHPTRLPLAEKLLHYSIPEPNTGCRLWLGEINSNGYGRIASNTVRVFAHRASYESFVGPIPEGMNVLHRCDNRLCVNPDHLMVGTQSENLRQASARGRLPKVKKQAFPFNGYDRKLIPLMVDLGFTMGWIAKSYGVGTPTISRINADASKKAA